MELSAIALKTWISFSLGLSANASQNPAFGDSLKVVRKATSFNYKNSKTVKQNKLKPNGVAPKSELLPNNLSSCGKCGKG
ncbi:MAG: hypothetical protein H0U95_10005 [Bacteroidetes bacterium]|nr:hypothetical protein [Bacteroidota bacterium]